MLRWLFSAAVFLAAGPIAAQADTPGAIRVKPVEVTDTQGFGRPLTAFTLMVPHHWTVSGGVVWGQNTGCNRSGYNFDWRAETTDESEGIGILPVVTWQSQPGGPCPQMNIRSARDFLTQVSQRLVPNAQILDYRQRPDLLSDLQSLTSRQDYGSMAYETAVDAGEVLISFPDPETGRDMRASLMAQIILWRITTPAMFGMAGMDVSGGSSLPGFVAGAPAGRLDLRIAEAIRKSIRPGLEWQREIARHEAVLARQNRQHSSKMAQITAQTNSDISDIIHQGYRDRSAIRDRGQRESIEAIRGVETYNDPINGGTVQLDNTYSHAWQLNDGSYVLTNDNFFDPNRGYGVGGQRLQVTP